MDTRTLEEKILGVLKENSEPMRALDIANMVGHLKKDVNRVIYKMSGVEKVEGSPPKWRIKHEVRISTSPVRTCTTSGGSPRDFQATSQGESSSLLQTIDLELEQELLTVLKKSPRQPKSALQLAKDLGKVGRRDVNPSLHRLEKRGLVRKLSDGADAKPLWQLSTAVRPVGPRIQCEQSPSFPNLSTSDDTSTCEALDVAKWKGDALYTRTDSNNGSVTFTPLSKGEILNSDFKKLQLNTSCQLDQEDSDSQDKTAFAKVLKQPVGQEVNSSAVLDDYEQHAEDELKPRSKAASSPVLSTGKSTPLKKKPPNKLAANFTNPPSSGSPGESDASDILKSIVDLLAQHRGDEPLATPEISEALRMPMRATAMGFLRKLKSDGIVEELDGNISRWKLAKN